MNTYKRTQKGENFAAKALSKMLIYFTDGNERTFYSRDYRLKQAAPNRDLGIARLKKYAYEKKQFIQTAVIYDNETGNEVCKFREGYWQ